MEKLILLKYRANRGNTHKIAYKNVVRREMINGPGSQRTKDVFPASMRKVTTRVITAASWKGIMD
jgi:hypothetical protein